MWRALRSSRDFRLLVAGELVSRAGTAASFVAVWAVAVYEFRVGPVTLSILALCNTVPRVLASAVAGKLVDRHSPRVVLLVANAVGALGSFLQWASPNVVTFGLATLVAGASFGAFMPAMQSMSPRVVEDRHLHPANALLELTWQIGFIFGPLAGVAAIALAGNRGPLLFDAATFLVGIACAAPIRLLPVPQSEPAHLSTADTPGADLGGADAVAGPGDGLTWNPVPAEQTRPIEPADSREPAESRELVESCGSAASPEGDESREPAGLPAPVEPSGAGGQGEGFRAGLRYTWALPVARFVLIMNTGSWLGIAFFLVLEPLYVAEVLGAGPSVLGLLQTAFGIGAIGGAALVSRIESRVGPRLLAVTLAVCGAGAISYTASRTLVIAAAGVTVWGVGIGMWAPTSRTMIQRGVPMTHHGRVNGVMSTLQSALEVLPVLAAGQLAVLLGVQPTLIAAGGSTVVLALWGLRRASSMKLPT